MSQAELETILSISVPLLFLAASIIIYWVLRSRWIDVIRRAFARLVWRWEKNHRFESYVKGLRELVEDEGK